MRCYLVNDKVLSVETYGHWWRGQISFERGLWKLAFIQDLLAFQVGISFGLGGVQVYLGLWSLWVARLWPILSLETTPPDIEQAINRNLFDLL
jgi:hypothetical protein